MSLDGEVRILGPLEVVLQGRPAALGGARARSVLGALALAAPGTLSRDRLLEEVWGEAPTASAAHAVQVYVSRLRGVLGAEALHTGPGPTYALDCAADAIDARRFERLATEGRAHLPDAPEQAARVLASALSLWRGPVLDGISLEGPGRVEVSRLEELRLVVEADRLQAELRVGRHREVLPDLEALVLAHPLRERLRALLMLARYRAGRQAEALESYRDLRRRLVDELGLEPSAELRALHQAILTHDASVAAPRPPAAHRLPAPLTGLIGRERELVELDALIGSSGRLVTLTGPGGIGKTRLAIATAERVAARFAGGARFVDLSALRDPRLVRPQIATVLGLEDEEQLEAHLSDRDLLLVLDNFEHLTDAAPDVSRLLFCAAGLCVLVTSRGRLDLYGEHEFAVPPLEAEAAATLFAARARMRAPGFSPGGAQAAAVAEIVARLDGLPLAIELVAARTAEVAPADMLAALPVLDLASAGPRDVPERHRALRAAIDWSCEGLTPEHRRLFARLGVFAGGLQSEAAGVASASEADLELLSTRGLLRRQGGSRWTMLQTIRERALEQLRQSSEAPAVRRRHGEYFLALAEASEEALKGPEQQAWGERVEREHDNLRAALDWALAGDVERRRAGLRMAAALGWFWYTHGHAEEGARWLEAALERAGEAAPPLLRGRAMHVLGILVSQRGELETSDRHFRAGLSCFREAGDEARAAGSLNSLAANARERGDLAQARALFSESVVIRRRRGERRDLADPLSNLGVVAMDGGDLAQARALLEESLQIDREYDNARGIALNLTHLGALALERGEIGEAARLLEEGLEQLRVLGDRWSLLQALDRCAALAAAAGQAERAAWLAGAADAQRSRLGERLTPTEAALAARRLAPAREQLGLAAWERTHAAGAAADLEETLGEARALVRAVGAGQAPGGGTAPLYTRLPT